MHGGNISVQTSRVARLAVPHRKESREGQLVEGDCVWGVGTGGQGGGGGDHQHHEHHRQHQAMGEGRNVCVAYSSSAAK